MKKSNECLLYENVLALMPSEFKPITFIKSRRKLYQSPKGVILFTESKVSPEDYLWSGVDKDILLEYKVSYVCLTAGFIGILLIPANPLIKYFNDYQISKVRNGRTNLKIYIEGERFCLKGRKKDSELDLTDYFIPNENDDYFFDYIQSSPIEDIWQKAKAFVDYEEQYREGYNIRL